MTIHELFKWINAAQDWHEKNWTDNQRFQPLRFQSQAIDATCPVNANSVDLQLACLLMRECWNESQDWLKEYNKLTSNE